MEPALSAFSLRQILVQLDRQACLLKESTTLTDPVAPATSEANEAAYHVEHLLRGCLLVLVEIQALHGRGVLLTKDTAEWAEVLVTGLDHARHLAAMPS